MCMCLCRRRALILIYFYPLSVVLVTTTAAAAAGGGSSSSTTDRSSSFALRQRRNSGGLINVLLHSMDRILSATSNRSISLIECANAIAQWWNAAIWSSVQASDSFVNSLNIREVQMHGLSEWAHLPVLSKLSIG
ncbi:unnamed protein product [Haemonchus placei]|uniref:Secreted protein n=1 Tax=Haemonchus placei TaxID=6290 RepID=A0A0N4X1D6_HAEPC|nr:unnamed protein product [Haemonchus placei]